MPRCLTSVDECCCTMLELRLPVDGFRNIVSCAWARCKHDMCMCKVHIADCLPGASQRCRVALLIGRASFGLLHTVKLPAQMM
jgi:hypothetical protein